MTSHGDLLPRIPIPPDALDRRRGGIWVVVEFNGDEYDTVAEKKASLGIQMRDSYEALFTAGRDDLAQVDANARIMIISAAVDEGGHSSLRLVNAFKTSLKREVADTADWSAKESLDFNEIWDVLLLNVKWRRELQELEQGG
jgi:hypothetical protein